MTDLPHVQSDADDDAFQRHTIAYLTELDRIEATGETTALGVGPFTGLNLLALLEYADRAPGLTDRHHRVVDHLRAGLAPLSTDLIAGKSADEITAVFRDLSARETAGERIRVHVGPATAMTIIGMLQMATRDPQMQTAHRRMVRDMIALFAPLFAGTPGEQLIAYGNSPDWDVIEE